MQYILTRRAYPELQFSAQTVEQNAAHSDSERVLKALAGMPITHIWLKPCSISAHLTHGIRLKEGDSLRTKDHRHKSNPLIS